MNQRVFNYILVLITLTTFVLSLLFIKYGKSDILDNLNSNKNTESIDNNKKVNEKRNYSKELKRFLLPVIAMFSFFAGCYFVSLLVQVPSFNWWCKVLPLLFLAAIFYALTVKG